VINPTWNQFIKSLISIWILSNALTKFVETTGSSKSCVLKYDAIGVSYFLQPNRIKTVGVIANQCNDFPLAIFDKMLIIITVLNLDRPNE
jgi:hypothetical protein